MAQCKNEEIDEEIVEVSIPQEESKAEEPLADAEETLGFQAAVEETESPAADDATASAPAVPEYDSSPEIIEEQMENDEEHQVKHEQELQAPEATEVFEVVEDTAQEAEEDESAEEVVEDNARAQEDQSAEEVIEDNTQAEEDRSAEMPAASACCAAAQETCPEDFVSVSSDAEQEDEVQVARGDANDAEAEEGNNAEDAQEQLASLGDEPEADHPQAAELEELDAEADASKDVAAVESELMATKPVEVVEDAEDAVASDTTDEPALGDAQLDMDVANSDSDNVALASDESETEGRILHVHATLPQDLYFTAPAGCVPGQVLAVQGPHGPLHVQAPQGVKPGARFAVRLAPPFQHEVFVPAGAVPGQKLTFLGENDEELEAIVPAGVRPGQTFHVSPPVVLVPVPTGAVKGDRLAFTTPNGKALMADVPEDLSPGQYFSVQY